MSLDQNPLKNLLLQLVFWPTFDKMPGLQSDLKMIFLTFFMTLFSFYEISYTPNALMDGSTVFVEKTTCSKMYLK